MKHLSQVTVSKASHCGDISDPISLLVQISQGDPFGCIVEIFKKVN